MLCTQCGNEVADEVTVCEKCSEEKGSASADKQNLFAPPKHASTGGITLITNADLRAYARQQLKGVRGKMAFATLVFAALVYPGILIFADYGEAFYNPFQNPILYTIFYIAVFAASGAFALGFAGFYLKRIRGEAIAIKNIFDGFKRFLPSFLVMFFFYLFVFLWSLLLIVPGIIKMHGYLMAFYIMYDNPGMKPLQALKRSQIMMKGHKGKLFMLFLSFFGWFILGTLTLGIGFLWIIPYFYLSMGNFYETLKKNQEGVLAEADAKLAS